MKKVLNLRQQSNKGAVKNPSLRISKGRASSGQNDSQVPPPSRLKIPRISWEAPSFYYNPQKRYLSLIILALALGGSSLLFFGRDMLTAIFLLLVSLVIILYSNKRPLDSKITINEAGIMVDGNAYYYKDLKSFWINYNPNNIKELSLESKKWYMPYIKILTEKQNPLEIRSFLISFLPEKEHENSLTDIISRKIGL